MIAELVSSSDQIAMMKDALEKAGLPTGDIGISDAQFLLLREGEEVLGFIGAEGSGEECLLRSAVVSPEARGKGIGGQLVKELEAHVRANGCQRLHLLTTTAADFFSTRGYQNTDRSSAPAAIRRTKEFSGLCPDSANYMVKHI